MNDNKEKLIVKVSFDDTNGKYNVVIPSGMTLNEVIFGFVVVIKCLIRDGVIDDYAVVYDLLTRYLNDPQFEEVRDENV